MKAFGHMRFSYFGRNDTKVGRSALDEEERFNVLYNPVRMEDRFHYFENITLPSIRAQTDQDFRIIVATSSIMPEIYRTRLEAVCQDVPQIEIIYDDTQHITRTLSLKIAEMTEGLTEKTVHFRLDDDDAIARHVIKSIKKIAQKVYPETLISLPRGLYLTENEGKPYLLRKVEPYIAIAWAMVNAPGDFRTPYNGVHGVHYKNCQSFMDARVYSYIHVAHEASDTKAAQARKLKNAISFDKTYDSERGQARISEIVERQFPGFTVEKLHSLILNAPSKQL